MTIFTVGVYGFTAQPFVEKLRSARVTALIDIRRRRGVRGAAYRFANATALEKLVLGNGIKYIAEIRLAPTAEIREFQKRADNQAGVAKRDRDALTPSFVSAYRTDVLDSYPANDLELLLSMAGDRPCLLCVERLPTACHRSLAAEWIAAQKVAPVVHVVP